MTQEEKELLIKDLCARLPYGVKIQRDNCYDSSRKEIGVLTAEHLADNEKRNIVERLNFKPFLRPLSNITEDERKECKDYLHSIEGTLIGNIGRTVWLVDWLNAHHFDYRGLIEKGLAIEVNKSNNPYA